MVTTLQTLYGTALRQAPSSFEAGELFRLVTGKDIHQVTGEEEASPEQTAALADLLGKRSEGIPLQYLLGEWEFYSLPFKVGPGVLIPRQDTETLVDTALSLLRNASSPEVLDLCSGTGCVALSILRHKPDAKMTALEFSPEAFSFLEQNIALHGAPAAAVLCDLREYTHPVPLDMIVSNPPYIPRRDFAALQREVGHEPLVALDGGHDGLHYFRAIARRYRTQFAPGGKLLLEIGAGQKRDVVEILEGFGYCGITSHPDAAGIVRVLAASYSGEALENGDQTVWS